jgi:hypothetical protein
MPQKAREKEEGDVFENRSSGLAIHFKDLKLFARTRNSNSIESKTPSIRHGTP